MPIYGIVGEHLLLLPPFVSLFPCYLCVPCYFIARKLLVLYIIYFFLLVSPYIALVSQRTHICCPFLTMHSNYSSSRRPFLIMSSFFLHTKVTVSWYQNTNFRSKMKACQEFIFAARTRGSFFWSGWLCGLFAYAAAVKKMFFTVLYSASAGFKWSLVVAIYGIYFLSITWRLASS